MSKLQQIAEDWKYWDKRASNEFKNGNAQAYLACRVRTSNLVTDFMVDAGLQSTDAAVAEIRHRTR